MTVQEAIRAVADIICEAVEESGPGGVPSGHMYAALMGTGMSLASYDALVSVLVAEGRLTLSGHVLRSGVK